MKAIIPVTALALVLLTSCESTGLGKAPLDAYLRAVGQENAELTKQVAAYKAQSAEGQEELRLMAEEIDRLQRDRLAADNSDLREKLEAMARLEQAGTKTDPSYVPPDANDVALSPEVIAQLTRSKQSEIVKHLHLMTEGLSNTKGHGLDAAASYITSQLADAIVAWRPPAQMVQGTETIVSAAIAYAPDQALASSSVEGMGPLRLATRQVTETVYVLLTSDESGAFRIEKLDDKQPDEQLVRSGAMTYWQWRVTPLIEGPHTLRLQPYLVFVREGTREKKQRIAVPPEVVSVTISRPYQIKQVWKEQKPTILSVFVFPFVTWGALAAFRRVRLLFRTKPPEPPLIITA